MSRAATTIETVADAMVTAPKTWPAGTTVAEARAAFADDHVHMLLLVSDGVLLGTLVRDDLLGHIPPAALALPMATLRDRTTRPDQPIEEVRQQLIATGHRRLAVVDSGGRLLGLLCLKRDLTGFCSDSGVAARGMAPGFETVAERPPQPTAPLVEEVAQRPSRNQGRG